MIVLWQLHSCSLFAAGGVDGSHQEEAGDSGRGETTPR